MSKDIRKKAVEMLLRGATLLSEPCPYCKGVRVMKNGDALCINCGKSPDIDQKKLSKDNNLPVKKLEEKLESMTNKLSNENFIANAPEEIVNKENNKKIDLKDELEKINSNINMLS